MLINTPHLQLIITYFFLSTYVHFKSNKECFGSFYQTVMF